MTTDTPMATRIVAGVLATVVTLVCAGMAGLSAINRSPTTSGAIMFVALALVMVVGSHLLPALARNNKIGRAVFVVCVAVTLYNHAYFFQSEKDASSAAAVAAVPPSAEAMAIQAQLDLIVARALPVVSTDMAAAQVAVLKAKTALTRCEEKETRCGAARNNVEIAKVRVAALQDERAQAVRAEGLREQLALAITAHSAKVAIAGGNKVDISIAELLGIKASTVGAVTSILQSVALEVMGALLWAVALPKSQNTERKPKVQEVRIKHIVPYNPTPKAPRLIGWVQKALVQHQAQPRDSPTTLRPA